MNRVTAIIFVCLAFATPPLMAITINGTDIPDTISLPNSGTQLVLNGAGIREKFFMDIYVGALYLEKQLHDPDTILSDTSHACILMHFTYSEVSREKIIAGWTDGLAKNLTAEESADLAKRAYILLAELPEITHDSAEQPLRNLAEEMNVKVGQLFHVVRVAVTGQRISPPLFESMEIIGREKSLARLDKAIKTLENM